MVKQPELLAPVGKIESFYAAVENGANAIYVGGKQFSARQFADNLDNNELKELLEYAKLRNVKVYVTVNTLIKNEELDEFVKYVQYLCEIGIDALIVQDFGAARIVKEYFPSMPLHASTQMSAHSIEDVKFLKSCGYERVVLARELRLEEIEMIKKTVNIELEVFVHGALCVCYSGQCLMSSMIGGRSGNRGRCAQPCRLPYTLKKDGVSLTSSDLPYLMSPKDMETIELIPKLIKAGIDSFKIEGRMKTPEYVASVIRVYRKYIDLNLANSGYNIHNDDKNELLTVFNRGGFTKGYFTEKPGKNMMTTVSPKNSGLWIGNVISYNHAGKVKIKASIELHPGDGIEIWTADKNHVGTGISKNIPAGEIFTVQLKGNITQGDSVYLSKNHQLLNELKQSYKQNNRKSSIVVHLEAKVEHPIKLTLVNENGVEASVLGEIVSSAQNAPITKEQLYKQIGKFGNTPFQATDITVECDSNIYVSISSINELRRRGTALLIEKILSSNPDVIDGYKRYMEEEISCSELNYNQVFSASVQTLEQLEACVPYVKHLYWELKDQTVEEIKQAGALCHQNSCKLYIALPHIERNNDYTIYQSIITEIETTTIDGYVIRTYGQYEKLRNSNKKKVIDYTLNVMNNQNIQHWESLGVDVVTLSVEMSADEIQKIKGNCLEMIIYGYIPIMTTEQCLLGRYGVCQKGNSIHDGKYELIDRKNENYPIITDCKSCRMQMLSSKPIVLSNKLKLIQKLPIQHLRFLFTIESDERVKDVISWYIDGISLDREEYTNGYFIKGVE